MDNATTDYILNHYYHFMTLKEKAVVMHWTTSIKFRNTLSSDGGSESERFLLEKGWLSRDKEILDLLKDGYENFRVNTAERIASDNAGRIHFNHCAKCGKLARTPLAKQCRFCGYDWHSSVAATFQVVSAFALASQKMFFVSGIVLTGSIKPGMKADLTIFGLAAKPEIKKIGFIRRNECDVVGQEMGLGFTGISEEDEGFLKSNSPFKTPMPIEKGNTD